MRMNQVTLPCLDYAASVAFYRALGLRLIVDSPPRYARFEMPEGEATLSLHLVDLPPREPQVVVYFEVDDVDVAVKRCREAGVDIESDPIDQRWLWREAYLRDPAGNRLCLFRAGRDRRHPPWRIERSD